MPKIIRAMVEQITTVYEADGTVRGSFYTVRYQVEDVDDPALAKWVDVETPDVDTTRTVTAQRDQIEDDARIAEGIARRL
jgi:hypothetical protein